MKAPLSWLKDYVDITLPLDELAERLTLAGLEVGSITAIGDWWDREKIVVGEVREVRPHPAADRLVLVDVAYGGDQVEQCVTGAPNLFDYKDQGPVHLKVAFAMEGAELYDGHKEGFVKTRLKPTKIRGVPSRAMVCSEKELGLSDAHEGILFLPANAPVGMPLADYLGDVILDLDLTPNLARCFNMLGIAREIAALTRVPLRYPSTDWQADGPPAERLARVEIEDPGLCPRYIAAVIQNVEIGPAPYWMQDRLHKAGMRPINNIVDITNFVMLEWGQPLHAFDYDKLAARAQGDAPTIIVRPARPGETLTTLDGVKRDLPEGALLICDTVGPIAVAGVMGGLDTEVDENSRNILLEAANFNFLSIRRTTQVLRLPSEANLRFGKGIHPALAEPAARRASELMRQLGGGVIAQGLVDACPLRPEPVVIDLTLAEVERNLGLRFGMDSIVSLLEPLEFRCQVIDEETLRVTVPEHRVDCAYPADLIEDLARIYGYDNLPVTEIADRLPPQRANRALELEEQVRDLLVACGLQEVVTYSLTHPAREALLKASADPDSLPADAYITLANPINPERVVMRRRLLTTVLETAAANLRFRDRVEIFEVGRVFLPQPDQQLPDEALRLAIVMTGPRDDRHWLATGGPDLDFFDLKGVVEALLGGLHIGGATYEAAEHPTYQPGRTALLRVNGVEMGILGELHPQVRAALESLAARLATSRITEEDAAELRRILDEMMEAARQDDIDKIVRLDNSFHEAIMRVSRNKTLYQLWKTLQFGTWSIVTYRKTHYEPAYLAARHQELLEALLSRSPSKAMKVMQRHIEEMGTPPDDLLNGD